jgi:hypothetical protein
MHLLANIAACALFLNSTALAAVTVTLINRHAPFDGSTTADGFTAHVIRLTSDSGEIIAFDLSSTGHGLFGPMVQRWTSSAGDGRYDTKTVIHPAQNTSPGAMNFDSHLFPITSASFAYPDPGFDESLGSGGIPLSGGGVGGGMPLNTDFAGVGVSGLDGFMTGQYLIPGIDRSAVWDLAYVVLRNGDEALLRGQVLVATAGGNFAVQIPEPLSSLVAPILLAVLTRPRALRTCTHP